MGPISEKKIKILHLEDLPSDAELVERALIKGQVAFEKIIVDNKADFENALIEFLPDIILSDHSLPAFDSIQALKILKAKKLNIPFVLITSAMTDELAVSIMKEGADDYIIKDRLTRLPASVFSVLEKFRLEKEKREFLKKIEKNEMRFRSLIEKGTDMKTLSTVEGKIIYGSPNVPENFGFTREEFINKNVSDFLHPDDIPDLVKNKSALIEMPGASFSFQYRFIHKTGKWIWCEGTLTNLLHEPSIQAFVSNFRDISDKKIAEQLREFDKNNLSALINNTNDLMWSIDKSFNLISYNEPFSKTIRNLSGFEIHRGDNVLNIGFEEEKTNRFKIGYERAFRGESFVEIEYNSSPVEFWSEISYYPIRNEGEVVGTACHSRDITESQRAEQLREFEKNNLSALINNTNDLMWSIDKDFKLITSNKRFDEMAKTNFGKIIEKGESALASSYSPEMVIHSKQLYERAFLGETFTQIEYFNSPFEFWSEISYYPIRSKGEVVGTACHSRDITQEKKAERKLKNNEARLKEAQNLALIGSWEIDLVTKNHVWSDELYKLFDIKKEDVITSMPLFLSVIHPDDLEFSVNKTLGAFETFQDSSLSFRFLRKDRSIHYGYAEYKFEFDNNGKAVRMYGVVKDMTEIKIAEIEILKMNEQLRNLSNHIQGVREEERKKVSREIHDELGQQLTALKMDIDWILHKQSNPDVKVVAKLNEMLKMNDGIINTVRRISSDLRPAIIDDLGLIATIEWKCSDFEDKMGIPCNFISTVKERLFNKEFSINVYRILQETLTNVSRHADAKSVTVLFTENDEEIILQIADDGKGIMKTDILNSKRLGVLGMKERAVLLGGSLTIEQGIKKGTSITLRLPMDNNYDL